jgi:hypothetical protein
VPEAADFIAYAVDGAGVDISAESGRTVPVSLDALHDPAFLQPDQEPASSQVFADSARRTALPPYSVHWIAAEASADPVLARILYGRGLDVISDDTTRLDQLLQTTDDDSRLIFTPPTPTASPTP